MNRIYKFRAWHKQEQKMYPVVGTFYNLVSLSSSWEAVNVSQDVVTVVNIDTVELMQFTGLHDRLGKEIYEGDIVKGDITPYLNKLGKGSIFQVIWNDDSFCWDILPINKANVSIAFAGLSGFGFEVIGNIYEHPDLLTKL